MATVFFFLNSTTRWFSARSIKKIWTTHRVSDKIFTADWFSFKKAWTDHTFNWNLLIRFQDDFLYSFFPHVTLFIFVATIKRLFTLSFVLRPLSSLATIKLPRAIEGTTRSTISTDSLESRFKGKMKNPRRSRFDIRPWKYRNLKLDNRQARIKSREYGEKSDLISARGKYLLNDEK